MKLTPEARCRANVEAWFAEKGGPRPKFVGAADREALGIVVPIFSPARTFIHCTPEILACLKQNSRGTWTLGAGLPAHQPCGCATDVDGGRELRQIRYALQWILHSHCGHVFLEIDFDGWNPGEGAGPAAMHFFVELIPHRVLRKKTNPFKVAKYRKWT